MTYEKARLDLDLAAYTAAELAKLQDTVSILLAAVDDGSTHYHVMQWRIENALAAAIKTRLERSKDIGGAGTIVPFPRGKK